MTTGLIVFAIIGLFALLILGVDTPLVITAASVAKISGTTTNGTAGETITAGMSVYLNSSDGKMYMAQSDGTAAQAACLGIALHAALAGQPLAYLTSGRITIGATVMVGQIYAVSATFGGICLSTGLVSTNNIVLVAYADTATTLTIFPSGVVNTGVAVP